MPKLNPETHKPYTPQEFKEAALAMANAAHDMTIPVQRIEQESDQLKQKMAAILEKVVAKETARGLQYDPNSPRSEAAIDQGWDYPNIPEPTHSRSLSGAPRRRRSYRGPVLGEIDIDEVPAGHEHGNDKLTAEEIAAGTAGLQAAREVIANSNPSHTIE